MRKTFTPTLFVVFQFVIFIIRTFFDSTKEHIVGKRVKLILLLTLFFLTSSTAVAKTSNSSAPPGYKRIYIEKPMLFGVNENYYDPGPALKLYADPPVGYSPAGSWRWVYEVENTQHDRQHYTSSGRQIVYAGYWNAGCDYVYMNWSGRQRIGASIILQCKTAIFDWLGGVWDYTAGGAFQAGPSGSFQNLPYTFAPNIDITPDNSCAVSSMSLCNEAEPWKSYVVYGDDFCPTSYFPFEQALPGPPNLEGITTGYCDENLGDGTISPYLWPIIDIDTTDNGRAITHIVHKEWGLCDAAQVDPNNIDVASLIYQRKIATSVDQPETGTWDGPHFIDSVYNIAYIVRADHRPGNHNVYLAYMKPMYYQYDGAGGSPCTGTCAYQLLQDVVYVQSTDDGDNWSFPVYVTDYKSGYEIGKTQPAAYELTGFIDPNGTFHLVWTTLNNQEACEFPVTAKLYHWDNSNDCISIVYDGSEPSLFPDWAGGINAWNLMVAKPNISWCDDRLYVSFVRYGAYADTLPNGKIIVDDIAASSVANTDIMVVASDNSTGDIGRIWTDVVNITNTYTDSCLTGQCESEHWATMAMYSTDSLMIEYILDLEAGSRADPNDPMQFDMHWTDNPVIFMTWPCFTMSDLPQNNCISTTPSTATFDEVALAPNGNTAPPCNTLASISKDVIIANCGNVNYSYTAVSNDGWLTIDGGGAGSINAGTGPSYSDNPAWNGRPGCASPVTISWTASSATLGEGNYTGTISVNIAEAGVEDFNITVNLVVTCEYYLPEYARITGGCWIVDLWNTPQAGNGGDDPLGNMTFYACGGDSISPLYHEALAVGWQEGGTIKMYSDAVTQDSGFLHMRALSAISQFDLTDPPNGSGYYKTEGFWSTPDSNVQGKIAYFVPYHQDTSVLIEKVTLWNTSGGALSDFIVGEESDWDCDPDSSLDAGFIDFEYEMVFMTGDHNGTNVAAGLRVYPGSNPAFGAAAINGYDYGYFTQGWYPDTLYNKLESIMGNYSIFSDSANGTEMRILNTFYSGTLGINDTLEICKVKAVSLTGQPGLRDLMDKGFTFLENYGLCEGPPECQGICGDANGDGAVNVSDPVWIINYICAGGWQPQPLLACGDANSEGTVDMSDAVWILLSTLCYGPLPGDCSPGSWSAHGGDCCPFITRTSEASYVPQFIDSSNTKTSRSLSINVGNVQVASSQTNPVAVGVPVTLNNDLDIYGATLGFYYDEGDVEIDSISRIGSPIEIFNCNLASPQDNLASIGFSSIIDMTTCDGIPPGQGLLATLWFTVEAGAPPQTIPIDSGFFPPAGYFILTLSDGYSYTPSFFPGSITIISGGPQDNITTDPVFLISPGGHVPFRVYMHDSYGDPIVGDSTIYVSLYNCNELIRCPGANPSNVLYPEAPSDENGIVSFYLDGGKCDLDCVATVMRGATQIAQVPVRMFDVNGDLKVSFTSDFGYSLCNDYNGNGDHDFEDQNLWTAHLGDSCAMDACDRFEAVLDIIPRFHIVEGQYINLELALSNNNLEDCYIGLIAFYLDSLGSSSDPLLFGTEVYNAVLGAGEADTVYYEGQLPFDGPGTFMASFLADCCSGLIEIVRHYDPDSACVTDVNQCSTFRIALDSVPVYAIDTIVNKPNDDWAIFYTHKPAFPLYTPDSLVYNMCTPAMVSPMEYSSLQTYIWYDVEKTQYDYMETYVLTPTMSGDANCDCVVNVSDAVYIINYVFIGGNPPCFCIHGDTNCDGSVNVSDAVYIINYVFIGGNNPCEMGTGPEPQCGKLPGFGKYH